MHRQYHPGLPSIEQAKNDYSQVFSDHIPLLVSVDSLKIVSWNVLESDAANGFATLGRGAYGETREQTESRYDRIAEALANFVEKHQPQFICLQEICASEKNDSLFIKIKLKLQHYNVTKLDSGELVDAQGCITFYDSREFQPALGESQKNFKQFNHKVLGGNATEYVKNENEKVRVKILNVHSDFKSIPFSHEERIKSYLGQANGSLAIVVGDFNCTVSSLDATPRNITTSATVSTFRGGQLQGACAIDGCFYSLPNTSTCFQAKTLPLNPNTGIPYEASDLLPLDFEGLPELQKDEIKRYEMTIFLDEASRATKYIEDKYTVEEYQSYLQEVMANDSLLVRPAVNLNNENGIGVELTKEYYEYFLDKNNPIFKMRIFEDGTSPRYALFIDKQDTKVLMRELDALHLRVNKENYNTHSLLYDKVLGIITAYHDHLKSRPSSSKSDDNIYNMKLALMNEFNQLLTGSKEGLLFDKIHALGQIRILIQKNNDMSEYRGSHWQKFFRNLAALLCCSVAFPVGLVAAINSKVKYNTFQFWQTTGYKQRSHLMAEINSAENKLKK